MKSDGKSPFIVSLNRVDAFSLFGLLMAFFSMLSAVSGRLADSLGFMFCALLFDAFDGVLARKFGTERPFGRYLDGFIDAVSYVAAPGIFLYCWGFNEWYCLVSFVCYGMCALVRLSVFNDIGNIKEGDKLSYLGMPVFWMHFVCAGFYLVWLAAKKTAAVFPAVAVAQLIYSVLMVLNRRFYKPRNKIIMSLGTLGLAVLFFCLGAVK